MTVPSVAYLILEGLGAVLTAASAVGLILHTLGKNVANLNARIRAWWLMVILLGGASLLGRTAVIILFGLVSAAALHEFVRQRSPMFWIAICVILPAQYALIWLDWYGWFALVIPICACLLSADLRWGLLLCVYCLSYIAAVLNLLGDRSVLLMAFLIIVVQASDVLQYIFGKLLGRLKIAPSISPGKTVEGLLGGIAGATCIGAALWWITPYSRIGAAAMALLIVLLGFAGGLLFSAIKRSRGIKDWGSLLAGHGGILDRVDSLCLSAPVFYVLLKYRV